MDIMSDGSPLDDWRFLVGEWKAAAVGDGEFGEEGVVEGKHVFTEELGGKFIVGRHESWEAIDMCTTASTSCTTTRGVTGS